MAGPSRMGAAASARAALSVPAPGHNVRIASAGENAGPALTLGAFGIPPAFARPSPRPIIFRILDNRSILGSSGRTSQISGRGTPYRAFAGSTTSYIGNRFSLFSSFRGVNSTSTVYPPIS